MSQSQTIAAIAEALSKAQGAMKAAELDRINPFFKSKYATIASVWEAIRKPLSDNGLCVVQVTRPEDGALILETRLLHASGEWLAGELVVTPVKNDPQGVGSALTYARRYGLAAIVGAVSDEDDDGEVGSGKQPQGRKAETKPTPAPAPPAPDNDHAQADVDFAAMQSRTATAAPEGASAPDKKVTPCKVNQAHGFVEAVTALVEKHEQAGVHTGYKTAKGYNFNHVLYSLGALGYSDLTTEQIPAAMSALEGRIMAKLEAETAAA